MYGLPIHLNSMLAIWARGLFTLLVLGWVGSVSAEGDGWDERLTARMLPRWQELQAEVNRIGAELESLPKIPREELGGTGGLLVQFREGDPEPMIEVRWKEPKPVDLVVLVPARKYDVNGLILDYGLPDRFSVELIGIDGATNIPVAVENGVHTLPIRKGYPFVYPLQQPVMATGLRMRAHRLQTKEDPAQDVFIMACSEIQCFAGGRNVARDAQVQLPHALEQQPHWHWSFGFCVDGQTTLGLPELPGPPERGIGWLSRDHASALDPVWVLIDLGESRCVDGLRLYPARRPSLGNIPGFGMPRRFRVDVSESGLPASYKTVLNQTGGDMKNSGYNPVELHFPAIEARYVKLEATKLWKPYDDYPAFLALSEIEVLNGNTNIALGAQVISSDQTGLYPAHENLYWDESCLTDGRGPKGELVNPADWLMRLDRRRALETRWQELRADSAALVTSVRRWVFGLLIAIGSCSLIFSVIFPFRSRLLRKRALLRMRESIAGDLHDEVGSNLGGVQLFADLALRRHPDAKELVSVKELAAETVAAVRDIVWLLRPRASQRVGLAEHLRETGAILLADTDWSFRVDDALLQYDVSTERAHDLMLFYREAIHNLRHAKASSVLIEMTRNNHEVVLSIQDDGCGMDPETLRKPSTFRALRQRAERIGGVVDVVSEVGKGTAVTLAIPA